LASAPQTTIGTEISPADAPSTRLFNLSDKAGNFKAFLRANSSIDGSTAYVPHIARVLCCPPDRSPFHLYAIAGLWTWGSRPATRNEVRNTIFEDDPDTFLFRMKYTSFILDAWTFEPIETFTNPITGRVNDAAGSLTDETMLVSPRSAQSLDRPGMLTDRGSGTVPFCRFGPEIIFYQDGIAADMGPHQPRGDSVSWRVNLDDLLNPALDNVTSIFTFTGVMRAWERPWLGFDRADPTQILWNVTGQKVFGPDNIPLLIRDLVSRDFPDRLELSFVSAAPSAQFTGWRAGVEPLASGYAAPSEAELVEAIERHLKESLEMPEDRPWYMDRNKVNRIEIRSMAPGPEPDTILCKLLADLGVFYRQHQTSSYLLRRLAEGWRVERASASPADQGSSSGG